MEADEKSLCQHISVKDSFWYSEPPAQPCRGAAAGPGASKFLAGPVPARGRALRDSLAAVQVIGMENIPSAYIDGYANGRTVDAGRAENYVAHTTLGDPVADAMVADLTALGSEESSRLIRAGMHGDDEAALRGAPASVRAFFESCANPPDWVGLFSISARLPDVSQEYAARARRDGGRRSGRRISTNIAKSFFLTGKLRDQGIRRLKQNNRHMLEIFMPGGMEMYNDGWTHSIRVRLVHAKNTDIDRQFGRMGCRRTGHADQCGPCRLCCRGIFSKVVAPSGATWRKVRRRGTTKLHGGMAVFRPSDGHSRDDSVQRRNRRARDFQDRVHMRTAAFARIGRPCVFADQFGAPVRRHGRIPRTAQTGRLHSGDFACPDRRRTCRAAHVPEEKILRRLYGGSAR